MFLLLAKRKDIATDNYTETNFYKGTIIPLWNTGRFLVYGCKKCIKNITTTAGLEPARAKPKRFLIFLLNHSDKLPQDVMRTDKYNCIINISRDKVILAVFVKKAGFFYFFVLMVVIIYRL